MAVENNPTSTQGAGDLLPSNGNALPAIPSIDAESLNQQGQAAYKEQRYEDAEQLFGKAIELEAMEPAYRHNRGQARLALRRFAEAEADFRTVISLKPDYDIAHAGLGQTLFEQKRFDEAKAAFEQARLLNENNADTHNGLGRLALTLLHYEDAEQAFAKAIALVSAEPAYHHNRGLALLGLKRFADAEVEFRTAINLKPDYDIAHGGLGQALFEQKRYDEAKAAFERARSLNENDAETYNGLGRVALTLQQNEDAEQAFAKAIALAPTEPAYHHNRGLALLNLKRFSDAEAEFRTTISLKPDYDIAHSGLGQALLAQKRNDEAKSAFEQARSLNENNPDTQNWLGLMALDERRYEDAGQTFRRAVNLDSKSAVYHFNLALSLDRMMRYEEALREYDVAAELPGLRYAAYGYHNKAELLQRQGKYGPAKAVWFKACEEYWLAKDQASRARDADYFGNFGNVLYGNFDNIKEAERLFREGLDYDANHTAILAGQVGLYLDMQERHEFERRDAHWEALQAYQRVVPLLEQDLARESRPTTVAQLAKLFLQMEAYADARKWLLSALPRNDAASMGNVDLVDVHATLGVVCMRQKEYPEAVERFEQARRLNPNSLTIRSNLAGAYSKAKRLEKAEAEYRSLLAIAPTNLESLVGLGEVYTAMGDAGDVQRYETAIAYFTRAIMIAYWEDRSKTLKRSEEAALHYSLGYARVRLYETDPKTGPSILNEAKRNFARCTEIDPGYEKANRARKKLDDWLRGSSPERIARYGPTCIFVLSLMTFMACQCWFYGSPSRYYTDLHLGQHLAYYVTITFGSLLFMIAGLYLPQILKLRVGGIELEKTSADQIAAPRSFGITNSQEETTSVPGPLLL